MIKEFRGKYKFLSNFYESPIRYNVRDIPFIRYVDNLDIQVKTSEHFFQACKATNIEDHLFVKNAETPMKAKRRGRLIRIREDWDNIKLEVMSYSLWLKFTQNEDLKKKLVDTFPLYLQEGNHWNDTFWGFDLNKERGENWLGRLLMIRRSDSLNKHIRRRSELFNPWTESI